MSHYFFFFFDYLGLDNEIWNARLRLLFERRNLPPFRWIQVKFLRFYSINSATICGCDFFWVGMNMGSKVASPSLEQVSRGKNCEYDLYMQVYDMVVLNEIRNCKPRVAAKLDTRSVVRESEHA